MKLKTFSQAWPKLIPRSNTSKRRQILIKGAEVCAAFEFQLNHPPILRKTPASWIVNRGLRNYYFDALRRFQITLLDTFHPDIRKVVRRGPFLVAVDQHENELSDREITALSNKLRLRLPVVLHRRVNALLKRHQEEVSRLTAMECTVPVASAGYSAKSERRY